MYPFLYSKETKTFGTNGIGRLSDATSCFVTEERNGQFELEMKYPVDGVYFSSIKNDTIIFAKAFEKSLNNSNTEQAFRVYSISKPLNRIVTIKARHISYQLSYTPIGFIDSKEVSASTALTSLQNAVKNPENDFNLHTDITGSKTFKVDKPVSLRNAIGGDGGFIETYGGEVLWDNYDVYIYSARGYDNGVIVRYGKNLTSINQEENIENTFTACLGYYSKDNTNDSGVTTHTRVLSDIKKCSNASSFQYTRTYVYDATSDFDNTVKTGYKNGNNFYVGSDFKTKLVYIKNNYYKDQQETIQFYFYNGSWYSDNEHQSKITPQANKYYIDQNTIVRGYYEDGRFWTQKKQKYTNGKSQSGRSELWRRSHVYYCDNTSSNAYVWNGKNFVKQSGNANTYNSYKAVYLWNGKSYSFVRFITNTNTLDQFVYRYDGKNFVLVKDSLPLKSDINRLTEEYIEDHDFGVPKVDLTVSYQPLWQTLEYKDTYNEILEAVNLCDKVTVIFEKLDINVTTKVTKTKYNVLLGRYDEITLTYVPNIGASTSLSLSSTMSSSTSQNIANNNAISNNFNIANQNYQSVSAKLGRFEQLITDSLSAAEATIDHLKSEKAEFTDLEAESAHFENLSVQKADIDLGNIKDACITNAKIADAQITSAKIEDASVTTIKIAASAVTADKIAAGTITTDKLFIGSGSNLYDRGYDTFSQITNSTLYYAKEGNVTATIDSLTTLAGCGTKCLKLLNNSSGTDGYVYLGHTSTSYGCVPVNSEKVYIVSCWMKASTTVSAQLYVVGHTAINNTNSSHTLLSTKTVGTSWVRVWARYTASSSYPYISIRVDNDTKSSTLWVAGIQIETGTAKQEPSDFHSAGVTVINGNNILAGSVTANQIAAKTIIANNIKDGTITGSKLVDSTITGGKIANATITDSNISNGTITGSKLVDSTIEAAKIKDGTITGAKIADSTITGGKLTNATIEAAKIKDGTITGAKLANTTITGAKIADSTITGGKLSADAIDGKTITGATIIGSSNNTEYLRIDKDSFSSKYSYTTYNTIYKEDGATSQESEIKQFGLYIKPSSGLPMYITEDTTGEGNGYSTVMFPYQLVIKDNKSTIINNIKKDFLIDNDDTSRAIIITPDSIEMLSEGLNSFKVTQGTDDSGNPISTVNANYITADEFIGEFTGKINGPLNVATALPDDLFSYVNGVRSTVSAAGIYKFGRIMQLTLVFKTTTSVPNGTNICTFTLNYYIPMNFVRFIGAVSNYILPGQIDNTGSGYLSNNTGVTLPSGTSINASVMYITKDDAY